MQSKNNCSYLQCANRAGLLLVILFVLCFVWYYIRPVEQELHLKLLKLSFYGFTNMNVGSFILGVIQSYIWGYIAVGAWQLVGCCCKPTESDK